MIIELIAKTMLPPVAIDRVSLKYDFANGLEHGRYSDGETLIEFAGRNCYQSFRNESGRDNPTYIKNIIRQEHFSVLEHASCTFFITGVSRSFTHELIRHRHLSFSELSQRYVNVETADYVVPPVLEDDWDGVWDAFLDSRTAYWNLALRLENEGLPRKRAREAARSVMPNCTETKIVVTGNLRAWRDVLAKRGAEPADLEMRKWAVETYSILAREYPAVFFDFERYQADDGFEALRRNAL